MPHDSADRIEREAVRDCRLEWSEAYGGGRLRRRYADLKNPGEADAFAGIWPRGVSVDYRRG